MKMPQRLVPLINWTFDHYWNFVTGLFFAFIGYFSDMKGAFHVMFCAFILDLALGIRASKKIRKERFSMERFFTAVLRMAIAFALIMLLFAMDKEMHQDTVSLAYAAAWLVTGFLAYSAADNGFQITGGVLFLNMKKFIGKKFQDNTGIDIEENPNQPTQTTNP
jgi:drug/metabolite transporter (DMT)-like permease